MATIAVVDDFATQDWDASFGTPVRAATSPLHGSDPYHLEISQSAAMEYVYYTTFGGTPVRVVAGFWYRVPALPAAGQSAMIAKIDAGTCECKLRLSETGALSIAGDGTPDMTAAVLTSGIDLVVDTWYWFELMVDKSANPWEFRVKWYAGEGVISGAAAASNCGGDFVLLGSNEADTHTGYYSYLNYGTASSDSDWLGEQSAVTLTIDSVLPDADITTTGWTTTPLYSKVNDASDATVIQATAV